jgi:hypothetical protein
MLGNGSLVPSFISGARQFGTGKEIGFCVRWRCALGVRFAVLVASVLMRGGGKDEVGWQGFWSRLRGVKGLSRRGNVGELSHRLHQH